MGTRDLAGWKFEALWSQPAPIVHGWLGEGPRKLAYPAGNFVRLATKKRCLWLMVGLYLGSKAAVLMLIIHVHREDIILDHPQELANLHLGHACVLFYLRHCLMHVYPPQSTCANSLQHMWIGMNTCASKQGLTRILSPLAYNLFSLSPPSPLECCLL
jgi:hypothetical protein